jgi:hypothetical protein
MDAFFNKLLESPSSQFREQSPMGNGAAGRIIVASEIGGLGNRFKAWASARRMSPDALVHWPVNDVMPATFSDMFSNDCGIDEIPDGAKVYRSWRLHLEPEDLSHLPQGFTTAGSVKHPVIRSIGRAWWTLGGKQDDRYRYMLFPKSHSKRMSRDDDRHIDLEYSRIPAYFLDLYTKIFQSISPRPEIVQRVNDWAAANIDDKVIGVQVRSWRDEAKRHKKYHLPAMKRLHAMMASADTDSKFFVVSDSDEVIESLIRRYGAERTMAFPRTTDREASWHGPAGIIEDLIDMLLLARTQTIFASYLSTFSEAAWWFGGARADVSVF